MIKVREGYGNLKSGIRTFHVADLLHLLDFGIYVYLLFKRVFKLIN